MKKWFTNQFEYVADAPASREHFPKLGRPWARVLGNQHPQEQPWGVQSKYPTPDSWSGITGVTHTVSQFPSSFELQMLPGEGAWWCALCWHLPVPSPLPAGVPCTYQYHINPWLSYPCPGTALGRTQPKQNVTFSASIVKRLHSAFCSRVPGSPVTFHFGHLSQMGLFL